MIFLTAPKDLQQSSSCEEDLGLVREAHEGEEVVADRDLFENSEHWRGGGRGSMGKARNSIFLPARVGRGGRGFYSNCGTLKREGFFRGGWLGVRGGRW